MTRSDLTVSIRFGDDSVKYSVIHYFEIILSRYHQNGKSCSSDDLVSAEPLNQLKESNDTY